MHARLNLAHSFEIVMALACAGCAVAVGWTFVIGQHYIIPTFWLAIAVLTGNLARYGFAGARWAKEVLFWFGVLASANTFMGLFFAKTPKAMLGGAFLPVWGLLFVILAGLTWQYARRNALFGARDVDA